MTSERDSGIRFAAIGRHGWLSLLLVLMGVVAMAQDYPRHRGNNQGQGRNVNPALHGPGIANLRWFHPNLNDAMGRTLIVNNVAGPDLPAGNPLLGFWTAPTVEQEAFFSYRPDLLPGYLFSPTVAANDIADPRVGATAIYEWTLTPDPWTTATNYQVYAWLPIGPTFVAGEPRYPQRYYVFEVVYGSGDVWIDVVDTFAAGTGWVRLGNGGRPTNQLFPYDGTNPIRVRLYNTVPRNEAGGLTDVPGETLVYADAAMAVPQSGSYVASPIVGQIQAPGGGSEIRTVAVVNEENLGRREGDLAVARRGVVTSYSHDHAGPENTWVRWRFTPLLETEFTAQMDNDGAGVAFAPPWEPEAIAAGYFGANYLAAPITNLEAQTRNVVYAPTLEDGEYEVYLWLPGDSNGETFGHSVRVTIVEGLDNRMFSVDQSLNRGWVRVGTTRFQHTQSDPIRVVVSNFSDDPADVTRKAYADAVRFVGATNLAIESTPLQTRANIRLPGGVVERDVVIVATENGRLYCLDAYGNDDGTTNVYWTYPSTPDAGVANWTDPNQVPGQDGAGPIATMPNGYNLSSALVQRIAGNDYLYIASTNGRIYCIDMTGRGDMDFARRHPGTTTRVWTYPDDFPGTARASTLGAFSGSLVYAETAQGPTIFAPTTQGRLYALNALPTSTANKTTSVRWTFPALNQPTIGAIRMTPLVEFGNVYFGTDRYASPDGVPRGRFFALNADNGSVVWSFDGGANPADSWGFSGPTSATAAQLNDATMGDTVFALNQNGTVYAFAAQGAPGNAPNVYWASNELQSGAIASLTFTTMSVLTSAADGTRFAAPVVLVPTADGRFSALFARTQSTNRFGTRRAWEFVTNAGEIEASMAQGNSWLYGADTAGNLFAFNNDAGSPITPGTPPGEETIVENDPIGDDFRDGKIKFINRETYNLLRGNPPGLSYTQALDPSRELPTGVFEWGQTVFILVYDFPFRTENQNGDPVPPPAVNFLFSVDGRSNRSLTVESRRFTVDAPPDRDGYAILAFSIQGGGVHALPPGDGSVGFSFSTASTSTGANRQNIVMQPGTGRIDFTVANPLAVVVQRTGAGAPDPLRSIGATTDPANPQNRVNGSPNVEGTALREDLLTVTPGVGFHGQSTNVRFEVIDRSLMTLLRGPGRGLDNVRVERTNLAWFGGASAVLKPLDPGVYTGFEDLPVNFPNTSLDYPDLPSSQVRITKDIFGNAENPLLAGVTLNAPRVVDQNNPLTRVLRPTTFDVDIALPRYQPANLSVGPDSAGGTVPYGYLGSVRIFVDTNGNGQLDLAGRGREAFREVQLTTNVAPDERIYVGTPVVDLGALGQGANYAPTPPGLPGSDFTPWTGPFAGNFREFEAFNDGNVNLLNVRLAKSTNVNGANYLPWQIPSAGNHPLAWLDGQRNVHSDLDEEFSIVKRLALQKPRVGDGGPTRLSANPVRRTNPNLGVVQGPLVPGFPARNPRVTASIPIGMPVGSYLQTMRVIEDTIEDSSLRLSPAGEAVEAYSDPGFVLKFSVTESRLTSGRTPNVAPMLDRTDGNAPFRWANDQPSGARDTFGNLVLAFSSTRPDWASPFPGGPSENDAWRIYVGSLTGRSPALLNWASPLRDLNVFGPADKEQWFARSLGPLPNAPIDYLFNVGPGQAILAETIRFGAPVLPSNAFRNPLGIGAGTNDAFLVYLGSAQKDTASGRVTETRLYAQRLRTNEFGGVSLFTNSGQDPSRPYRFDWQPLVPKGKPAVVQVGDVAFVAFVSAGTSGHTLYVVPLNDQPGQPGFGDPVAIPLGDGFEFVGNPTMVLRPGLGGNVLEVAFEGRLRGRSHGAIYHARLSADTLSVLSLETRERERLSALSATEFAARGLRWNAQSGVELGIVPVDGVYRNLERPNTRQVDANGVVSFETLLGGRVFLDPARGQIRFAGTAPPANATLFLTYTPRVYRMSANISTNYGSPSLVFDRRLDGDASYWARPSGAAAAPSDEIRPDRFIMAYTRTSTSPGEATRPVMATYRLGLRLPFPVATNPNGSVVNVSVSGANGFYQIDPAQGRIYFTLADEGRTIQVNYTAIDPDNGQTQTMSFTGTVALVQERSEAPIPMEHAANEGSLSMALDSFEVSSPGERRPGLIWMFWRSTRFGSADLFFQTIAPRFAPVPAGGS